MCTPKPCGFDTKATHAHGDMLLLMEISVMRFPSVHLPSLSVPSLGHTKCHSIIYLVCHSLSSWKKHFLEVLNGFLTDSWPFPSCSTLLKKKV